MKAVFYNLLVFFSKIFGTWLFSLVARGIATGYLLFSPKRRATGLRFYGALFPGSGRLHRLWCTWKQFQNFTYVFLDRFVLREYGDIRYTMDGWEHLRSTLDQNTGGILLMSHMGNWEVAAQLLKQNLPDLRLLLFMGARPKEEIEKIQKQSILQSGIRIMGADEGGGSPFDIVEGLRFLQDGGYVSMTGDVVWRDDQRAVSGNLLGHRVRVPESPYALALASGAPLFIFFAFRTGNRRYHFTALKPIYLTATARSLRQEVIGQAAQRYLDHIENALRQHPFEWFHFEPFLGPRA